LIGARVAVVARRACSMTEARNPLATALGTYYPRHYLVAVVDDPARAMEAMTALKGAGFAETVVELCPGPDFLKNYRDFEGHRSLLERAAGVFPSEEQSAVEEYLAEAERGASFVTVHVPEREERDRARDILHAHDGHAMRYYGEHTITDVS
jgi:hypothetical protein